MEAPVEPQAPDDQPLAGGNGRTPRPPRKFVLFADGTGNAFTTQESNVWRLYEALDRTKPDQVAYYIKGVGTSGWRPLAALDGATGFGVPSNVRKLYRFISWNWEPGDEIYMFGFSRGAFTAHPLGIDRIAGAGAGGDRRRSGVACRHGAQRDVRLARISPGKRAMVQEPPDDLDRAHSARHHPRRGSCPEAFVRKGTRGDG